MKSLKNGQLSSWKKISSGQIIPFQSNKPRHVKFQITANSNVEIWAGTDPKLSDGVLLGTSSEKTQIEYTAISSSYVMIKAEKSADIYINARDLDQTILNTDTPAFTNIEPRTNNSTEFDRMMQYVKLNEHRRDAELATERAAMRAELAKAREFPELGTNPLPPSEEVIEQADEETSE